MKIIEWLRLPQTRQIEDLDDPAVTLLHAEIMQSKPFLKETFFYARFLKPVLCSEGKRLGELGSGAGFVEGVISNVITPIFQTIDLEKVACQ